MSVSPSSPESRYALTTVPEITDVLRRVHQQRVLLQMSVSPGANAIVTTLLHIDAPNRRLIVDDAPGADLNARILAARAVRFEASLDNVRVNFSTAGGAACSFEGAPALSMPFPDVLMRIQRRDYFRVATPVATPVICRIPVKGEANPVQLPLDDISGGGLSMFDDGAGLAHEPGTTYKDCEIDLPSVGIVKVDLRLTNARQVSMPSGRVRFRLGCAFVPPSGPAVNQIQRYVTHLEREAMARRRGLG
ncbi:hypothetical protein GSY71_16970 [Pusillimonas sp. TS35]|uniref:flagellar brake protein n=1 Tax=Paracandidimonas lactea TaxID=2895524 RepID=UPI00136BBC56|nr:hypothetical protein [Pusillimonas sp. TS35]